jgi:hypothetical protein
MQHFPESGEIMDDESASLGFSDRLRSKRAPANKGRPTRRLKQRWLKNSAPTTNYSEPFFQNASTPDEVKRAEYLWSDLC